MILLFRGGLVDDCAVHLKRALIITNLNSKIKTNIKIKRKRLLFKEAVCKSRISLIKLFVDRNLRLLIFP